MATTINITDRTEEPPRFGQVWRDYAGVSHAVLSFGQSWVTFSDPADARAAAAACIQCAEAMEAIPPAPEGGQS